MGSVVGIFRVIREEQLPFWIFFGVNLFFGGMAIWLPPAIASQHPVALPARELLVVFEQGNGYLYGLALLAAASSYWLREYLNDKETGFKNLKLCATLLSFVLMIVTSIFLAVKIYQGFSSAFPGPRTINWGSLGTQIIFTVMALVMATYLF